MKLIQFPNLRSDDGEPVTAIDPGWPVAPQFPTKEAFRKWCSDGNTRHAFVSASEGVNPSRRIDKDNPVAVMHGIIVDYDAPAGENPLAAVSARGGKPTFIHLSQSGHIRLVWAFEESVAILPEYADEFIRQLHRAVSAQKLFPGFDETSCKVGQVYEIGNNWSKVGGPLPQDTVQACLFRAVTKGGYVASDTEIPIDMVAEEVERRWPRRWKGAFALEARGPLFWLDDGIDREGCQVKPDGMLCYSDRAGKGFIKWRELLGNAFVEAYESKKIAESLGDYWYDGKDYWRTDQGYGLKESKEDVTLALRKAGFSSKSKKGQILTEVEQALFHIQRNNRVDGAAPVIYDRRKIVTDPGGRKLVNLSRIRPVEPAGDGNPLLWPWTRQFLTNFLDRVPCDRGLDPYEYFWAWLSRTYRASHEREPMSGQALILTGPAGRGKTLFGRRIVGGLCGGYAEAGSYLTGKARFNKELSCMPVWTIDDQESAVDFKEQRRFTELMKKAVANPSVAAEAKGIDAQTVPWTGRVIMGTNLDAHSLSAIPSLDQSNRDKLMAFQVSMGATTSFPSNKEVDASLGKELPHLAKWLLDYTPNPAVIGDSRYGIRSYFHPKIEEAARDNSPRQHTMELIEIFVKEYRMSVTAQEWQGSTTELISIMSDIPVLRSFACLRHPGMFSRDLASAEEYNQEHGGRPIRSQTTGRGKIWTIDLSQDFDIRAGENEKI